MLFSNSSEKFLKNCDSKLKERLRELFIVLREIPIPAKEYDLKKICGEEDTYRIRLSGHRATYCIDWENRKIRVIFIEKRKESTYKQF